MDGSGLVFSNSAAELCPLYGRRGSKEVWMKLFAVHLATIAASCHVRSLQREKIISWRLLTYLLEPASIFIAHLPGLVIPIVATIYWAVFDRTWEYGKGIRRSIGLFVACQPCPGEPDDTTELEPILKRCGRMLLAYAYFTQCCGTIALSVRRAYHDAVTGADIRIFEVACTGVLISLYWILLAARVPIFTTSLPSDPPEETDIDLHEHLILRLRGVVPIMGNESSTSWQQSAFQIYGTYYLCVIVLIIKATFLWRDKPPREALLFKSSIGMQGIQYFAPNVIQAFWHFILGSWVFRGRTGIHSGTLRRKRPPVKWILARGLFVFMMVNLLNVPIFAWYVYTQWFAIATELSELEGAPVDQKCPLLWSDPAANWMWALG